MCKTLKISRSCFYYFFKTKNKTSKQEQKDKNNFFVLRKIFQKHRSCYGFRRLRIALKREENLTWNPKKIIRLQKKFFLYSNFVKKTKKNFFKKEKLRNNFNFFPNLLRRNFTGWKQNEVWATDVSYLNYNENNRYFLSAALDLKTRKVVSFSISKKNNWKLVEKTLLKAISSEKLAPKILHSDQGFQYFCNKQKNFCRKNKIQISMSNRGNPIDNAVVESFFGSLKKETVYNKVYSNSSVFLKSIRRWVDFYNKERVKFWDFRKN